MLYGTQFANAAAEIRSGACQGLTITPQSTIDCMHIMDVCRAQMGWFIPVRFSNKQ